MTQFISVSEMCAPRDIHPTRSALASNSGSMDATVAGAPDPGSRIGLPFGSSVTAIIGMGLRGVEQVDNDMETSGGV